MKYRITHTTTYHYQETVRRAYNQAHLAPRAHDRQRCLAHSFSIQPRAEDYRERIDYYGNRAAYFAIQLPHDRLEVTAVSEVEITPRAPDLAFYPPVSCAQARDAPLLSGAMPVETFDFSLPTPATRPDAAVRAYAAQSLMPGRNLAEAALELTQRLHQEFTYRPGVTDVSTPLTEVMHQRAGVCQDFAHLLIACFRTAGIPARYVSGYLETLPPPGQQKLRGADASHAWAAVLLPGFGWLDLDPTNGQIPDERYITTAWGRDYFDVAPLQGVLYGGGRHELKVAVDVVALAGDNGRPPGA